MKMALKLCDWRWNRQQSHFRLTTDIVMRTMKLIIIKMQFKVCYCKWNIKRTHEEKKITLRTSVSTTKKQKDRNRKRMATTIECFPKRYYEWSIVNRTDSKEYENVITECLSGQNIRDLPLKQRFSLLYTESTFELIRILSWVQDRVRTRLHFNLLLWYALI